ncbi:hypothetical protein O6P43_003657 [Quillaja saponaria]|uniref:Uncharacterized protein n=1 Tax=Quillaja saponaria TaxID=32244 RepID=A0AAD7QF62_QUISA|nr:hypothetical protein O6P43_003657 [Quillaja saponaria]
MAGRISAARLRELLRQLEEQETEEAQPQYRPSPPPVPTYNHGGYFHNSGTQNLNGGVNNTGYMSGNGNGSVHYGGGPINYGKVDGAINYGPATNNNTFGQR